MSTDQSGCGAPAGGVTITRDAAGKDVINVLQHKRLEGASTITQQVAKNMLLNSQVKFSRKIKEAILAVRIDATYSSRDARSDPTSSRCQIIKSRA